jgi:hypothetical protein
METFAGHGCFISANSETCEKMLEFHLQVGPALPSLRSALREEAWSTVERYSRVPPTREEGMKFPWGKEPPRRVAGRSLRVQTEAGLFCFRSTSEKRTILSALSNTASRWLIVHPDLDFEKDRHRNPTSREIFPVSRQPILRASRSDRKRQFVDGSSEYARRRRYPQTNEQLT